MPGPAPAVAAVRHAFRLALHTHGLETSRVLLAVSGGADSLAMAAAAAFVLRDATPEPVAVVVDHGLQPDSAEVAATAARACSDLGLSQVEVVSVAVQQGSDGPEAAARTARMQALHDAALRLDAGVVALGHTQDDQAEQVLLGLVRGSGARSLAGMPPSRPIAPGAEVVLVRPLLDLPRRTTQQACEALGLRPWSDPHNDDRAYTRVRARAAVADLERDLGPGVIAALARTASLSRDDADALDAVTAEFRGRLGSPPWPVSQLVEALPAVRRRFWQTWALELGSPPGQLSSTHLHGVEALVTSWRGQGPIHLPGGVRAHRDSHRMWLTASPDS